jgi:hypothetical protein
MEGVGLIVLTNHSSSTDGPSTTEFVGAVSCDESSDSLASIIDRHGSAC